jgi:hypothetical protein
MTSEMRFLLGSPISVEPAQAWGIGSGNETNVDPASFFEGRKGCRQTSFFSARSLISKLSTKPPTLLSGDVNSNGAGVIRCATSGRLSVGP